MPEPAEMLDQIDNAVGAWEARPESWVPGEPLYPDPRNADRDEDGQIVRPMIQVLDDTWPIRSRPRCEPCQVSWGGDGPCWVCGADRPLPRVRWGVPTPRTVQFDIAVDVQPFLDAAREAAEAHAYHRRVRA